MNLSLVGTFLIWLVLSSGEREITIKEFTGENAWTDCLEERNATLVEEVDVQWAYCVRNPKIDSGIVGGS